MTREHELLKSAVNEINSLRNENKIMRARLDMFDDCMRMLSVDTRSTGMGMSPDLVWEIQKHLNSISEKEPLPFDLDL